jgi:large conductance mechanosensitive channel
VQPHPPQFHVEADVVSNNHFDEEHRIGFLKQYGVIGLEIAVIIGGKANALVTALVDGVLMPIVTFFIPGGAWRTSTLEVGSVHFLLGPVLAAGIDFPIVAWLVFWFGTTLPSLIAKASALGWTSSIVWARAFTTTRSGSVANWPVVACASASAERPHPSAAPASTPLRPRNSARDIFDIRAPSSS